VLRAEVEGRGTVYRVRVGPFETQREAQTYRHEFERTERMNTLLVRRREGDA
jgi:cell division protein FtsN